MADRGSRDHLALGDRTLREHTAQGVLINGGFQVGIAALSVSRRFMIAIFLTAADFGLWGLIYTAVSTVLFFKDVGIGDKYIQQTEDDQEAAFQTAYSLELVWSAVFAVLVLVAVPIFSIVYGRPEMIAPGALMAVAVMAGPFLSPSWIYYREMRFVRQRTLLAIEPVVGFGATLALGAAGFSYWAIVIGLIAGMWTSAIACVVVCPYKLRWRYEKGTLREYFTFSWPLVLATGTGVISVQIAVIVGEATVGLAGIGAIGLAGAILSFADKADMLVTQTMYPAICAVRDRVDLLRESFAKSNRLALVWSVPFCFALTLFAEDLVTYVLGSKWDVVVPLLQAFGLTSILRQIAFNWTAFHRAVGNTRPIAVNGVATMISFVAVVIPGLILWGLNGYIAAVVVSSIVQLFVRTHYLSKLLQGFAFTRNFLRALLPSVPAVAAVLALRLAETGERTLAFALAELAVYTVITGVATWLLERDLLTEMKAYLRPKLTSAA